MFDHLSRTNRNALKRCVVGEVRALIVGKGVRKGEGRDGEEEEEEGEDRGTRFAKLSVLLQIAIDCQSLLNVVSEEVLKTGGL